MRNQRHTCVNCQNTWVFRQTGGARIKFSRIRRMVGQFPNPMFAINRSNVTRRLLVATILLPTAAGEQELVLRPVREVGRNAMYFKSLSLERLP
jgi:hypothetical protein